MTPDNNESSDNTANGTVVDEQGEAIGAANATNEAGAANREAEHGRGEPVEGSSTDHGEDADSDLNNAIAAEEALESDGNQTDPLGFGDQRMGAEAEPLDEVDVLREQLTSAEAKAAENWDRLLRLQAEMENQRKRAQNDVSKARKFALESIVNDLLPVKDSLEMGLAAAQADDADLTSIVEGADLTLKMLSQVFEKNNIQEINPVDEKFNPEFHQAMSMQEIEGKAANTVAVVMQKGYTLNDRLVRPALVMVAK